MAGAADVFVSFGADTGDLEAGLAYANSNVKAFSAELRSLANEMRTTGASADSEIGQKMREVGAELNEAKKQVSEFKEGIKLSDAGFIDRIKEGLEGLLAPLAQVKVGLNEMLELAAAAFAIEQIGEFAEEMGELGEKTEIASAILGVPTEEIGKLSLVAQESGLQIDELQTSFARLSRNIADQSKNAGRALEALGLSFQDLSGKGATEQLNILAERFSKIEDGANKDAIAMELMGRAGTQMIPFLNKGAEGMEEIEQKAVAMGLALDEATTGALSRTHEGFVELSGAIQGAEVQAFLPFKGAVDGVVQILTDLASAFTNAMEQGGLMRDIMVGIATVLKLVVEAIAAVIAILREMWTDAVATVDAVAIAFTGLYHLLVGIFQDLAAGIGQFFASILAAGVAAARGVGEAFSNLGATIKAALTGDFSGASASFSKIGTDAKAAAGKVAADFGAAFDGIHFSKTADAFDQTMGIINDRAKDFKDDQVRIIGDLTKETDAIWGTGEQKKVEETKKAEAQIEAAQGGRGGKKGRGGAGDGAKAEEEEVDGEIKALQEGLKRKEALYESEYKLHQITESQKVALTLQAVNEEYQAELGLLQKELQIDNLKVSQRQAILNKIKELEQKHATEVAKINEQAAEIYQKQWDSAFSAIEQSFNGQLSGLLNGTTNWKTAMQNIVRDLEMKIIQYGEDIVKNWLLGETTRTAGTVQGVAARTAAEQAGSTASIATNIGAMIKQVVASAGETFAGIFGFLSPVMGPAAAGPAAAGQAAVLAVSMPSLDIGTSYVPNDMVAKIHQGEVVMPRFPAEQFRNMLERFGNDDFGGTGGGGTTHNWNFAGATLLDKNALVRMLIDVMNRNPSMRPSY